MKLPVRVVGKICVAALIGLVAGFVATGAQAGVTKESATVSVTIAERAGVGLVTTPTTTTATTTSTATSTSIRSVPISATSNVGYGSPAPSGSPVGTAAGDGASGGTSVTPEQAEQSFRARGAAPVNLGGASEVAVAGGPNQTFNVILPGNTSYSEGGRVVNLRNFQHSAGTTPALGSNGAGTFSIGAAVGGGSQNAAGGQVDRQPAASSAFTQRSPLVNIDVTYN